MESDAPNVVDLILRKTIFRNGSGFIVEDIVGLSSQFRSISFMTIPRVCNKPAHSLAK